MNTWTQERRLRQSQLIRKWKPWEKSTGAKTAEGKAISRMNSYKHGAYSSENRALSKLLFQYEKRLLDAKKTLFQTPID